MVNPIFTGEANFDTRDIHKCEETQTEVCGANLPCSIDIVMVIDKTGWNEPGLFDHLERMIPFEYYLNRAIKLWRIAVISVDETEATVEMNLAQDFSAYETSITNLKPSTPSYGSFDEERRYDLAFELIKDEEMGEWNAGYDRLVIVVGNGLPLGSNATTATSEAAAIRAQDQVTFETIQTGYYEENSTIPIYFEGVEDFLKSVADPNGGSNVQIHVDGDDNLNFGVDTVFNATVEDKISRLCNPPDREEDDSKCCGVFPCRFCLRWEVYGEETLYDHFTLVPGTNIYTASIDGMEIRAFRKARANCSFILEVDGVEIYSAPECPTFNDDGTVYDPDEVTSPCRNPEGSVEYTRLRYLPTGGTEEETGTFFWEREEEWQLQEIPKQPPSDAPPCEVQIAFVIDVTDGCDNPVTDLELQIDEVVAAVKAKTPNGADLYWGLVEVNQTTFTQVLEFTDDEAAFKTAASNLNAPDEGLELSNYNAMGLALDDVYNNNGAGTWRDDAQRWVIFGTSRGPAYGDGSYDSPADDTTWNTNNNNWVNAGHKLSGSWWGYYIEDETTVNYHSELSGLLGQLGQYAADGSEDVQGGNQDIATALTTPFFSGEFEACGAPTPGQCALDFCGNCTCVCNKICVDIQLDTDTFDSECRGFITFDGEICNNRAQTAEWRGTVGGCQDPGYGSGNGGCSWAVEVIMYRAVEDGYNEFGSWSAGDCLADITGEPGSGSTCPGFGATVKVECPNLNATFTIEGEGEEDTDVIVTIHCLRCGSCTSTPLPCCPGYTVPQSLNFYVVQQSTCGECNQPDPVALALVDEFTLPLEPLYTYQAVVYVPENEACEGGGDYFVLISFECRDDATGGASIAVHSFIVPGPGEPDPSVPFDSDDIPAGAQSIFDTVTVDSDCELPIFTFDLSLCGGFGAAPADGSANPGNAIGIVTVQ